jgi:hypothetical protein
MGLNRRQATAGPPKGFAGEVHIRSLISSGVRSPGGRGIFCGSSGQARVWVCVWLQPGWVRGAHKVFGETPHRSGRLQRLAGDEVRLRRWRVLLERVIHDTKAGSRRSGELERSGTAQECSRRRHDAKAGGTGKQEGVTEVAGMLAEAA